MENVSTEYNSAIRHWYFKRHILLIIAVVFQGISSLETAAISISALRYYKDVFKLADPGIYYSFCLASSFLSAIIASKLSGFYMDNTRNVKMCSMLLLFSTFGNVLYSIPFSKWLPIIGRFFCGFTEE